MPKTGVFPVFNNKFKVKINSELTKIAEMTSFSVSIDGNVEEWSPFDQEGWVKRLVTGKGLTISLQGKRCVGDAGNDYIAGLAFKTGQDCNAEFEWEFPSGAKLEFNCVINVTNPGGGESTGVDPLEFDVLSNGKPTFTPAASTIAAASSKPVESADSAKK